MSERSVFSGLVIASGASALAAATLWWWWVFRLAVETGYTDYGQAAACIAGRSQLCVLMLSLCSSDHPQRLTVYSPELFWAGASVLAAGIVLRLVPRFAVKGGE